MDTKGDAAAPKQFAFTCHNCNNTWQGEAPVEGMKIACPKCQSQDVDAKELPPAPLLFQFTCKQCQNSWQGEKPADGKVVCPKCQSENVEAKEMPKAAASPMKQLTCAQCGNSWQAEVKDGEPVVCPKCNSQTVTVADIPVKPQDAAPSPSPLKQLTCAQCGNSWQAEVKDGEQIVCPKCNSQTVTIAEIPPPPPQTAGQPPASSLQPPAGINPPVGKEPSSQPVVAPPTSPSGSLGDYFSSSEEGQKPEDAQSPTGTARAAGA